MPVVGVALAHAVFGEALTARHFVAGALVLLAILVVTLPAGRITAWRPGSRADSDPAACPAVPISTEMS
jgi:hypothetical protein